MSRRNAYNVNDVAPEVACKGQRMRVSIIQCVRSGYEKKSTAITIESQRQAYSLWLSMYENRSA